MGGNVHDQHTFLDHRIAQEHAHFEQADESDPLSSILSIEFNTTELCNRTCVFCPRHDPKVFPNRQLAMTAKGAETIALELARNNYVGRISFSGFGENFLNPEFLDIIGAFRKHLPHNVIECNTNGDFLDQSTVNAVFERGLNLLYINLYDGEWQVEKFEDLLKHIPTDKYKFRSHWSEDLGLFFNNRSGMITWVDADSPVEQLKGKPCYYPFYKMFVDWNGDVLLCCNDWARSRVVGNIMQQSLKDVWFSKAMSKVRNKLAKGDRSITPCENCTVDGTKFGKRSFDIIQEIK